MLKRVFDIITSVIFTICILSWLIPILGLIILLDSRGPVFFVQRRMGRSGRPFRCFKFRTMIVNDEAHERQAETHDYRITRVGKFLRITNLDEFPQFINVLIGDMSIVGPRPHMLSDCTRFSFVVPGYSFRTLARPGITGLAQINVSQGSGLDYRNIATRYFWDREYICKASLLLDLKVLGLTSCLFLSNVIRSSGALFSTKIEAQE